MQDGLTALDIVTAASGSKREDERESSSDSEDSDRREEGDYDGVCELLRKHLPPTTLRSRLSKVQCRYLQIPANSDRLTCIYPLN